MSQLSLDLFAPLDYRLVVSPRAKRLSMRVEPGRGLIVTVPKRFPKRDVPAFVEKNRQWIETAVADIAEKTPSRYRQWPPQALELSAIGQTLPLRYLSEVPVGVEGRETGNTDNKDGSDDTIAILSNPHSVELLADRSDKVAVASEIAQHLKALARTILPGRLAAHAQSQGLSYKRVQIRGQRTVWGTCSSSGTISLNYKLLFLRSDLLDYVLVHELAHTRFLNHSKDFWQFLESMHAGARELDVELGQAGLEVPPWLELAQ